MKLQMEGTKRDRRVTVAHYWYETSSRDSDGRESTTTYNLMVLVVHLQGVYPEISVQIRGPVSRIARRFGRQDPNSVGQESFDGLYRVRTEDPELIRRVMTPALVKAHLARTVPLWSLRDNELLTTHSWTRDFDLIDSRLGQLLDIADLLGTV
ncbi:MAG: hypothetical protein LC808_00995 [Actinobacteria bacterium]|nr:hypothetical protein [Actinomycetota bacterium]